MAFDSSTGAIVTESDRLTNTVSAFAMNKSETSRQRRPRTRRRFLQSKPRHNNGHRPLMPYVYIIIAASCLALTLALSPYIRPRTQKYYSCTHKPIIIQPNQRTHLHSTQMTNDSSTDSSSDNSVHRKKSIRISNKLTSNKLSSRTSRLSTNSSKKRKRYSRKLPPTPTERAASLTRLRRQAQYESMRSKSLNITNEPPSIWSFESLFARPVLDEESIEEDLFGSRVRGEEVRDRRKEREVKQRDKEEQQTVSVEITANITCAQNETKNTTQEKVDHTLTRIVQDHLSGLTRNPDGSVQFKSTFTRESPLPINIDRLTYFAKRNFRKGKLEEAQQFYLRAMGIDPTDGRAYLGLSRIAQRRGDLEYARSLLRQGVQRCVWGFVEVRGPPEDDATKSNNNRNKRKQWKAGPVIGTIRDNGPNPFLLQALGSLEQKTGNIGTAEDLYLQALRSRPSHAAAWVSLAQLRTKELRQGPKAARVCYQSAERELKRIGAKPNAFVYTAWGSVEYIKGDEAAIRRARELYTLALEADPHCSAAYLQLGVMEAECGNYDRARECFEKVLKFDRRNSRVLQAYAIMESRRPREEVDSRKVLDLFERALKANSRDAGVYQAYGLYVKELGDVDSARELLKRGTEVDKRHAPAWQAWGVLETRYSTAKIARDVFQQGIWACAQPGGGQSGGRRCARLWQAWGCLEAQEGEHAAARRCFSRALDADPRNVAAVTAWTSMEADIGNFVDARSIFQRTLKLFPSPSDDKMAIWRAWEVMEERAGNTRAAQLVFQRSMSDSMSAKEDDSLPLSTNLDLNVITTPSVEENAVKSKSKERVELSRLSSEGGWDSDVWMNNGSIEGKVPAKMMKKLRKRK